MEKNSGKSINEVEYNYLKWIYEKYDLENMTDINGTINKDLYHRRDNYEIKHILKNIELFENIYMTVKEHEDSYRNLDFKEYFGIDEDIDYKELQKENCIYEFIENYLIHYNYGNKELIQYNHDNTFNRTIDNMYNKLDFMERKVLEFKNGIKEFYCKFCDRKCYHYEAIEIFNKTYLMCHNCFNTKDVDQLIENEGKKKSMSIFIKYL